MKTMLLFWVTGLQLVLFTDFNFNHKWQGNESVKVSHNGASQSFDIDFYIEFHEDGQLDVTTDNLLFNLFIDQLKSYLGIDYANYTIKKSSEDYVLQLYTNDTLEKEIPITIENDTHIILQITKDNGELHNLHLYR